MAGRRLFTKKQIQAVEIVTGKKGVADHIIPYSKGGETVVENCQLISRKANQKKGAFEYKPRDWQRDFREQWQSYTKENFLAVVIPGGGKTFATLDVARQWMATGNDRRLLVVVPTQPLKEQWRDDASKFGIELQTKEFGTNFNSDYRGGVVTYSYVAKNVTFLKCLMSKQPTMVVFDEIHHCGEPATYGDAIQEAFTNAKKRLLLSGTAWRTDGKPIPYVAYDGGGYSVPNFFYDYPSALNDEVVRYICFNSSAGSVENNLSGETVAVNKNADEQEAAKFLRHLLDPAGDFVRQQITLAHEKLKEIRQHQPKAAALAACIDQFHAVRVAETIKRITGCNPSVIVSDADSATDSIKNFRDSSTEWLVTVRKVSEGVDIKRLQVLCYLTNTVTDLFFRQLVGRVSRYMGNEDREAHVFLPADPRLVACANNIENAQIRALKEQQEEFEREFITEKQTSEMLPFSYTANHHGIEEVIVGGESIPAGMAELVNQLASEVLVPAEKVWKILQAGGRMPEMTSNQNPTEKPEKTLEEQKDKLRSWLNKQAWRLSLAEKVEVGEIHKRFRPFKPQGQMTLEELKNKKRWLIDELKKSGETK